MKVPLIVCGHTRHEDKETIMDGHGQMIDVIRNVELSKKHNPNIEFYTIYSIDESINSKKYFDYFDKVVYSENIRHPYVGEKVKLETALKHIKDMDWQSFVKSCSRVILHDIERFLSLTDRFDYIGSYHETRVQFSTAVFVGNRKLADVWVDCRPHMDIAPTINTEPDWLRLYNRFLLENLFFDACVKHEVKAHIEPRPVYYSNYELGIKP